MELTEYIEKNLVHSIHTSERRSFRSCRRRWHWAYKYMYYPRTTPPALEFGVAFHHAMEVFYNPLTWGQELFVRQGLALVAFKQSCEEQLKSYRKINGEPEVSVLNEYKERLLLGLNMIRHYTSFVSPEYDQQFVPVEVEVAFEVPVLSPDNEPLWCKCDRCWKKFCVWQDKHESASEIAQGPDKSVWQGLPVTYGGRLDMLAIDEHGRYWVFDWKTTSRMLDGDSQSSFLELDDQIASYVWALRTFYDMNVAGFVYVEIKKAFPTIPDPLSRKYKGRSYSTSKTLMTTPEIYEEFVREHDVAAYLEGCYDEYLGWLKVEGPRFHQRHQLHKNDYELGEIGRNIYLEAEDIVGIPNVYPQPGRFSCPTCAFRQPCLGKNMGEDYVYTLDTMFERRTRHYYETEEPSTE